MIEKEQNALLTEKVTERSQDTRFKHHAWFVKYHLEIVAGIAHELCEQYPAADADFIDALVWLHDYEKIVDFDNQYNTELEATKTLMHEVGYPAEVIERICDAINRCNARQDLTSAPIEIQIVSSSDAASHLVGPFVTLYWYENASKSIPELQSENKRKLTADWEKKITLTEVKKAFSQHYQNALEIAGIIPSSFLK